MDLCNASRPCPCLPCDCHATAMPMCTAAPHNLRSAAAWETALARGRGVRRPFSLARGTGHAALTCVFFLRDFRIGMGLPFWNGLDGAAVCYIIVIGLWLTVGSCLERRWGVDIREFLVVVVYSLVILGWEGRGQVGGGQRTTTTRASWAWHVTRHTT